jgi:pimeloyl-ACP methyl ester carboxylesterase
MALIYFIKHKILRKVDDILLKGIKFNLLVPYPAGNKGHGMIQESFIHYNKNVLHYVKAGNGKHPLLVFHGFGQDHTLYVPLLKSLSKKYTLYIVDLFFHGKSEWNEDEQPLKKSTWNNILQVLFQEQHITSFSILAYSLGGKFALATIEAYHQQIKEVFLLAPDGIKTSFWYSLATYPRIFRNFFKSMILHHERFLMIAHKLNQFNLADKGLIRFADFQMNSEAKRKRVYYSWVVFRHLTFDLKKIAGLINQHHIELTLVVGKYDKVIRAENMHRLLKHVHHYRLEILESGHTGLIHESLGFLNTALLW